MGNQPCGRQQNRIRVVERPRRTHELLSIREESGNLPLHQHRMRAPRTLL
jgi:hypothetical protein